MLSGHNLPMLNEENRILETDHKVGTSGRKDN